MLKICDSFLNTSGGRASMSHPSTSLTAQNPQALKHGGYSVFAGVGAGYGVWVKGGPGPESSNTLNVFCFCLLT